MKVNLTKTYEVEFAKDGAVYKKGDKVSVNMLLAGKFFQDGRVATVPSELMEDAKKIGAENLFNKKKNLKDIV